MKKDRTINGGVYKEERALFMLKNAQLFGVDFADGESPLKESSNISLSRSIFRWKYPLWYAKDIEVFDTRLEETARSGIWYTKNIMMNNCVIDAPKTFRRSEGISLTQCKLNNAKETFWECKDIKLNSVKAKGDYFAMNCENIEIERLELDGNYFLDGSKNIVVRDSILNSKDSFWNTENVVVINCKIVGEYLGWNSKNITFINCEISSLQGLCYIDGLKMINCKLTDSTLCFEYCTRIDADIIDEIESVINPTSGTIRAVAIKDLIINRNTRSNGKDMKIITRK